MTPMNLQQAIEAAFSKGFTKIQPLEGKGILPPRQLSRGKGVSPILMRTGDATLPTVTYYLDGNRLIVKKALSKDTVYILS